MTPFPVVLSGVPHASTLSVFASSIGCEEDFETIRDRLQSFASAGCPLSGNILRYLNREELGFCWKLFRETHGLALKPRLGATTFVDSAKERADDSTAGLKPIESIDFQAAFSYSGKQRPTVLQIANDVAERLGADQLFYDRFYQSELAQPGLDTLLHRIYKSDSTLVVAFLSKDYSHSNWCREEWRLIRSLISHQNGGSNVMLVRFDDYDIDGLLDTDGYIDAREYDTGEISDMVVDRVAKKNAQPWNTVDFRFNAAPAETETEHLLSS